MPNDGAAKLGLPPRIGTAEFLARQSRARAAARAHGFSGLLAWGRGGATQDRYADLYYLSNFYTNYPAMPDDPGRWRARGASALVLPVEGPATLIVDMPAFRDDLVVADEVVFSVDVAAATAVALTDTVPRGRIGVLGAEALAWQWHNVLLGATGPRLEDARGLGTALRLIKSEGELALLRASGELGSSAVDALMDAAVPGATEAQVAAAGIEKIVAGGGAFSCIGISCGPYAHMYAQSQPAAYDGRYRLREGDMARVDLCGSIDGYCFDFGRTRVVGKPPNRDQQAVIDGARDCVLAGIEAVTPGITFGEIARRCEAVFATSDFANRRLGLLGGFFVWGHSLGLTWEPPWIEEGSDMVVQPGMCLAIEKRLVAPGIGGATYEDNLIVTESGCEVTTRARSGWK